MGKSDIAQLLAKKNARIVTLREKIRTLRDKIAEDAIELEALRTAESSMVGFVGGAAQVKMAIEVHLPKIDRTFLSHMNVEESLARVTQILAEENIDVPEP